MGYEVRWQQIAGLSSKDKSTKTQWLQKQLKTFKEGLEQDSTDIFVSLNQRYMPV